MNDEILLDSYAAKTCTYALHLDRVENRARILPAGSAAISRMQRGITFEAHVGECIARLGGDTLVAMLASGAMRDADEQQWADDRAARLAATIEAVERGVAVVWNPRLPSDQSGHRSGEPDLLVRVAISGNSAKYLPVDVKAHFALYPGARHLGSKALHSLLEPMTTWGDPHAVNESAHPEDLLQLAHYWRMLEACGWAPDEKPIGGVIGVASDGVSVACLDWFSIEEILHEYDEAFAFALAVVRRSLAINRGAAKEPLGLAWYQEFCHDCKWRGVCGPKMLEEKNVSLVRPNRNIWEEIDAFGISTISELAYFDPSILRSDGQSLSESGYWIEAIHRAQLAELGEPVPFALRPDVNGVDIQKPRLWRRSSGSNTWAISSGDVELDVDMECTTDHVYLWGTYLTYRNGQTPFPTFPSGYVAFGAEFPMPDVESERSIFLQFFTYLSSLIDACEAEGRTFRAYCYSNAEARYLRSCADSVDGDPVRSAAQPLRPRVEELLSSDNWVDLLKELRPQIESLNGLGLKTVAKALDFHWHAEDAGGEASMAWYDEAINSSDQQIRTTQRAKILRYNEDDVRATLHVREWFRTHDIHDLPVPTWPPPVERERRRKRRFLR